MIELLQLVSKDMQNYINQSWNDLQTGRLLGCHALSGNLTIMPLVLLQSTRWVEPVAKFLSALHDGPYMHQRKTQEHGLHSLLESAIDKGPYVNFMEDGMVAAVTNESVNTDDSLGNQIVGETELTDGMVDVQQNSIATVLQNECHSEVKNKSSSEDNVSPAQGPVGSQEQREELYTEQIQDAIAPVKKSINQLARSQGRSVWWLAYIAVVTSWPLLGTLGFILFRIKFRDSLPAKWLRS